MKIITLYNHKGGVSKTTSTFNLASLLADIGRRVLMVDADPQCNLTEIALAKTISRLDAEAEENNDARVSELPGSSVLDALEQRIKGDAAFIDVNKISLCRVEENIYLLRGSVDLSSIEDDLAEAHVQRLAMRTNLMRTYVAIGDFLTRLAIKQDIDYIFIDVGPSSGALTRAFFLACDGFFIPVAPDRFNVQAIGTLSTIIDRWMREHRLVRDQYKELKLPVKHGTPAFLGTVVQAYKIYAKRPKPGYKLWMNRLPKRIISDIRPVMFRYDKSGDLYLPSSSRPITVDIPDFNQLAPLMQEVGVAVYKIKQADTALISESGNQWMGNNWTQAKSRMLDYKNRIKKLVDVIENFEPNTNA